MSLNAAKLVKRSRHLCACGHRAIYVRPSNGQVAWRRDHDLCPRCWRASMESAGRGWRPLLAFGPAPLAYQAAPLAA